MIWNSGEASEKLRESIPMKRFGEPEDISGIVAFLCAPESSWMTGEEVVVGVVGEARGSPEDDAPQWVKGVAVGLFAAATAFSLGLSIAAAIKNAAQNLRRDDG